MINVKSPLILKFNLNESRSSVAMFSFDGASEVAQNGNREFEREQWFYGKSRLALSSVSTLLDKNRYPRKWFPEENFKRFLQNSNFHPDFRPLIFGCRAGVPKKISLCSDGDFLSGNFLIFPFFWTLSREFSVGLSKQRSTTPEVQYRCDYSLEKWKWSRGYEKFAENFYGLRDLFSFGSILYHGE